MTDLLQSGSDWLADVLQQDAAQTVTYHRGVDSVSVSATIGRKADRVNSDHDLIVSYSDRDFLIQANDLVLDGAQIEPKRGDKIKQTDADGTVHVYEVSSPGDEPCWRWSDRFHVLRRIHTQQIGIA